MKPRSNFRPTYSRQGLLDTALGIGCILAVSVPAIQAASIYWDGSATAGWDTAASWSTAAGADTPDPAAAPGAADDAIFNIDTVDGDTTVNLNGAQAAQSLLFNNTGATTLLGGSGDQTLEVGDGGITVDAGAGPVTIGSADADQAVAVNGAAAQTWTNNSTNPLVLAQPFTTTGDLTTIGPVAMTDAPANTTNIGGVLNVQSGVFQTSGDVTMAGLVGSGTIENGGAATKWIFVNNADDNEFSGGIQSNPDDAAFRIGLVKGGAGELLLSGDNGPLDRLAVSDGTMRITGTTTVGYAGAGANQRVLAGTTADQAGRIVVDGGTLNANYNGNPSIGISDVANSQGFMHLSSGEINAPNQIHIGTGDAGGYAAYTQDAGTLNVGSWLVVGFQNNRALYEQSGGTTNVGAARMTIGAGGGASIGFADISGGTFNSAADANSGIFVGENGSGTLLIRDDADLNLSTNGTANSGTVQFGGAASAVVGNLVLNGGSLETYGITQGPASVNGVFQVNFNGGLVEAAGNNPAFFADLPNGEAYVYSGGGTIDNQGFDITISEPLLGASGDGVSATGLTAGGGGYVEPPLITISGGGGTGATARAVLDGAGNLTGVEMTNPGVGYTSPPTFTVEPGGGIGANGVIGGTATLVPNTSGGMTFNGSGTTRLAGGGTFTGPVQVNAGTLGVGGDFSSSAFVVADGSGLRVIDPENPTGDLTVPSLSLGSNATLGFSTEAGASSDTLVVNDSDGLSFSNVSVNLYAAGSEAPALGGTYTLIEYSGSHGGDVANFTVGNPRSGAAYSFTDTGSAITVEVVSPDSDGDGMSDDYETANGLDPNDATGVNGADGNLDNDFATNIEEFIAGTASNDSADDPLNLDNDGLLDSWEVTNFGSIEAQSGDDDFDGDFDSNLAEFTNGTDASTEASFTDSEPDFLTDGWEIEYFGDITTSDGSGDADSDGFTDLQEFNYGSDPTDPDFSPAQSRLRHRWSFTGDLTDSVGGSDAVIMDASASDTNLATINADSVTLAGGAKGASQYINLGSDVLPSRNTPATIEIWATMDAIQNWSRVFAFQDPDSPDVYSLAMAWTQGTTEGTDTVFWRTPNGGTDIDDTNNFTVGTPFHIAVTLVPDPSTPDGSIVSWYAAPAYDGGDNIDIGPMNGTFQVTDSLAFFNDTVSALGRSWYGDNTASATYDEVRIWDGAIPEWELQGLHEDGPDAINQADSEPDGLPDAFELFYFGNLDQGPDDDDDNDESTNIEELLAGSDPTDPFSTAEDVDGDELPDAWEIANFGNISQGPNDDPDGDFGFNIDEFEDGTDPNDYFSFLDEDSDGMSDYWEEELLNDRTDDDGSNDDDGDGFTSLEEFEAETDPGNALSPGVPSGDADNDGLPDRWEIAQFDDATSFIFSLAEFSGTDDPDGDGDNNLAEYRATSDPNDINSTSTDVNGDGSPDTPVFYGLDSTGSGIPDGDGQGLPFTTRLSGSGANLPNPDTNLDLDTAAGTLSITSTSADINGQVTMGDLEALGIQLSTLGFTGSEDFRIRAHYVDLPETVIGGFDQIGAYVGNSTLAMTRAATFEGTYQSLGVNTNGTADANATFAGANTAGGQGQDLEVIIERVAGVWEMTCNGTICTPGAQPEFLDSSTDLQAGIFVLDSGTTFTATLQSFTAVNFGTGSGPVDVDDDNDGMADSWETDNFGDITTSDGTGDADGDGASDLEEFALNSDPNDASSIGEFDTAIGDADTSGEEELSIVVPIRNGASVAAGADGTQVATVGALSYQVSGSLDLGTFDSAVSYVGSQASGDPSYRLHTFVLDASQGLPDRGFLRIEISGPEN